MQGENAPVDEAATVYYTVLNYYIDCAIKHEYLIEQVK